MKKTFMVIVMVLAAITSKAEGQKEGTISITPRIGAGYTYIPDYTSYGSNLSLVIGADGEYLISEKFGVSVGLDFMYTRSGSAKVASDYLDPAHPLSNHSSKKEDDPYFTYFSIDIPILAQYHVGKHLAFKAGVQPLYIIDATEHNWNDSKSSGVNKFQLSCPVGFSYEFNKPITVEFRANLPLTKFHEKRDNARMFSFMMTVGYRFKCK